MGTLVSKVRAVLSQSRVRCLFRTKSKELSPGKHLLPTHPHSTPMGALSHKTWVLELPDPLLKVSLRAWCCRISGYEQSVSPLGWMETYVIEFRSLRAQHNSSPRNEGCETHSWTEAQKSKPTPKCKAAPQLAFSRFPTCLQEGTLAACLLWVFFPSGFLYLAVANALGPQQPLASYLFREIGMVETYAQRCSHRFLWANPQRNSGVENRLLSHVTGMSTNEHFFLGLVTCVHWSQVKSWISDSGQMLTWPQAECLDTF